MGERFERSGLHVGTLTVEVDRAGQMGQIDGRCCSSGRCKRIASATFLRRRSSGLAHDARDLDRNAAIRYCSISGLGCAALRRRSLKTNERPRCESVDMQAWRRETRTASCCCEDSATGHGATARSAMSPSQRRPGSTCLARHDAATWLARDRASHTGTGESRDRRPPQRHGCIVAKPVARRREHAVASERRGLTGYRTGRLARVATNRYSAIATAANGVPQRRPSSPVELASPLTVAGPPRLYADAR